MSKYHSVRTEVNGIVFSSKTESRYYSFLLLLKKAGEVKSIKMQVPFILQKGFEKDGKRYQPIKYVADFVVKTKDGTTKVIDVKGSKKFATDVFRLKKKIFEKKFKKLHLTVVYPERQGWSET